MATQVSAHDYVDARHEMGMRLSALAFGDAPAASAAQAASASIGTVAAWKASRARRPQ